MKTKALVILLAASILSGCYGYMRLYPVSGPLSTQSPLPVFKAKITGVSSGDISLSLVDGETCKGTWNRVTRAQGPSGETTTSGAKTEMASVWDAVYGPGFYVSRVLGGSLHSTAVVKGERGTVLNVEFISGGEHEETTKGVAKDNQGNVYKVVF